MADLIVTRHGALVALLIERGLVTPDVEVRSHVDVADVAGRRVFGVLPLHLAAAAREIVVVPLRIPPALRGVDLSLKQIRPLAGEARRFRVSEVK